MSTLMRPMLACPANEKTLRFPLIASQKLDGIRGLVEDRVLLSRSRKPIPNKYTQAVLGDARLNGFDGELILGEPNAPDVYRVSNSAFMAHEGDPEFTFYVFDLHDHAGYYSLRYEALEKRVKALPPELARHIKILDQMILNNADELAEYESMCVNAGFEGVILRDPKSPYKFGRSTEKEGFLMKLKRFEDGEARIIGFEEQMHNGNEAQTNELGRTKRSTAKEGLVPTGVLGALIVKDVKTGIEFNIGTGFDAKMRESMWVGQDALVGQIAKYKSLPIGVKDKPRHPVYLGMRDARDM